MCDESASKVGEKGPSSSDLEGLFLKLRTLLVPQGIITYTTGGDEVGRFLEMEYGSCDAAEVHRVWMGRLSEVVGAAAVMIGVPMDAGAGFERGSFKGPLGIRTHLHSRDYGAVLKASRVVDVGDVLVNPALVDASYYRDDVCAQVRQARRDRLRQVDAAAFEYASRWEFPVTPHDTYLEVMRTIRAINPEVKFIGLGGDHSLSRIPVEELTDGNSNESKDLGILHFDAHTDLLERRDGLLHSFATWAYHANERIGRGRRLYQVGIRVSGRSKEDWESTLDLVQRRMSDLGATPDPVEVATHLRQTFVAAGVKRVFISNDIDGTDPCYAASTGTMEQGGLTPDFVRGLIAEVSKSFEVVGSDVMEVAPPLNWHIPGEPARTLQTASSYVVAQLSAMLGEALPDPFQEIAPATPEQVLRRPSYTP